MMERCRGKTIRESMAKHYDEYDADLILKYKYPLRKIFNYLIYNWKCKSHIRKKQFFKAIDLFPCLYYSDMKEEV